LGYTSSPDETGREKWHMLYMSLLLRLEIRIQASLEDK
jgi:hypothetical protein